MIKVKDIVIELWLCENIVRRGEKIIKNLFIESLEKMFRIRSSLLA